VGRIVRCYANSDQILQRSEMTLSIISGQRKSLVETTVFEGTDRHFLHDLSGQNDSVPTTGLRGIERTISSCDNILRCMIDAV
jgi:hypothetical protein